MGAAEGDILRLADLISIILGIGKPQHDGDDCPGGTSRNGDPIGIDSIALLMGVNPAKCSFGISARWVVCIVTGLSFGAARGFAPIGGKRAEVTGFSVVDGETNPASGGETVGEGDNAPVFRVARAEATAVDEHEGGAKTLRTVLRFIDIQSQVHRFSDLRVPGGSSEALSVCNTLGDVHVIGGPGANRCNRLPLTGIAPLMTAVTDERSAISQARA